MPVSGSFTITMPAVTKRPASAAVCCSAGSMRREIDVLGVDVLLRRGLLHQHRRLGLAERAADEFAHAPEVDAERGLDVVLAGQQVADHRHVVAVHRREQQRRPAVELLHDPGDLEMRIDRRGVGVQASRFGHAVECRAKARIQHRIRYAQCDLPGGRQKDGRRLACLASYVRSDHGGDMKNLAWAFGFDGGDAGRAGAAGPRAVRARAGQDRRGRAARSS